MPGTMQTPVTMEKLDEVPEGRRPNLTGFSDNIVFGLESSDLSGVPEWQELRPIDPCDPKHVLRIRICRRLGRD